MKSITPQQCVALLPADPAQLDAVLLRFEDLISTLFWQPGDCKRMVDEGWIKPAVVSVDEVPAYFVGFHLTDDRGLWIDIAQTLGKGAPYSVLCSGLDQLAARERARYIRFYTRRRGIADRAQESGYQPEAVLMTKAVAV